MNRLEPLDRKRLLAIAHAAIEAAIVSGRRFGLDPADLPEILFSPAAAFVTLHKGGELRGCIGLMRFEAPVWLNVRDAAVAAARDDPRFMPVRESEVPALDLEISVLEPPVPIADPAEFVAGRHGIVVERGLRRGLLLPQVATEQGWGEAEMLDCVCRKAGLPGDAWQDRGTKLFIFDSFHFGDEDEAAVAEP